VTIATGLIDGDLLRAVIALRDMPSKVRRAARVEIPHRPRVTGQQAIANLRAINGTVEAQNVRDRQHDALCNRSEVVHQLVQRIRQGGSNFAREMCVDLGRPRAAMAQGVLDDPQIDAGFQ